LFRSAEAGFDSSERGLEAPRGFANVLSTKQDYAEITDGLGTRWEAALNSYKPFACGIVIHPSIDGCIQLRDELGERVRDITRVQLRTHPLVLELTGKKTPRTGLEGKFSVYHAAACALLRGDGAPTAFTDDVVNAPDIVALRSRVEATADPACHEDAVSIELTFKDGSHIVRRIDHAIGSLDRPLSDEQLEIKFHRQASLVIGEARSRALMELAWQLPSLPGVGSLTRAASPDTVVA
ncbi:MAG: MmgE/PrpD family protein, partial [Vicinamibacterales bacterium]